jgi:hypothetical protein
MDFFYIYSSAPFETESTAQGRNFANSGRPSADNAKRPEINGIEIIFLIRNFYISEEGAVLQAFVIDSGR